MEYSFEITRERCLNRVLSIQPSFQYIANGNGKSAVLLARLYCAFEKQDASQGFVWVQINGGWRGLMLLPLTFICRNFARSSISIWQRRSIRKETAPRVR